MWWQILGHANLTKYDFAIYCCVIGTCGVGDLLSRILQILPLRNIITGVLGMYFSCRKT